jgi:ribosomal protein S18 acetylase RimI-like enzyme
VRFDLIQATTPDHINAARALFQEYGASLGFNLCFQSFEQEVADLPGKYSPPSGRLLLARSQSDPAAGFAGCVALRKLESEICEMKRLYVAPAFRGRRIGELLADAIITEARNIGYRRMRLDTVPGVMDRAIAMYRARGFREIPPYTNNPVPGAIFLELELERAICIF